MNRLEILAKVDELYKEANSIYCKMNREFGLNENVTFAEAMQIYSTVQTLYALSLSLRNMIDTKPF